LTVTVADGEIANAITNFTVAAIGGSSIVLDGDNTVTLTATNYSDMVSNSQAFATDDAITISAAAASSALDLNAVGGTAVTTVNFADTAANNGVDTITNFVAGASKDVLNFGKTFLTGGVMDATAGVLTVSAATGASPTAAANKVIGIDDGGAAPIVTALAGYFKTTDATGANYLALADSGKAIVLHGDKDAAGTVVTIYYVDATLDSKNTDVSAADVVIVGTVNATDLDTFVAGNFAFA